MLDEVRFLEPHEMMAQRNIALELPFHEELYSALALSYLFTGEVFDFTSALIHERPLLFGPFLRVLTSLEAAPPRLF